MSERRKEIAKWVTGWLDDDSAQAEITALRHALASDPDQLAAFLLEIRLDEQLERCFAGRDQRASEQAKATPFSMATTGTGHPANAGTEGMSPSRNPEKSGLVKERNRKKWAKIVAMAWADEGYKARLQAEPAAVLAEEGLEIPAGVTVQILENTKTEIYLVLPAPPGVAEGPVCAEERLAAFPLFFNL